MVLYIPAHSWMAQENFHNSLHSLFTGISQLNFPEPFTANPGKCTITPSLVISNGETVKSPDLQCADIRCENENGLGIIMSCGVAMHPEGCKWDPFVNITAPYPHCCDRYIIC